MKCADCDDMITYTNFGDDWLNGLELSRGGDQISPFWATVDQFQAVTYCCLMHGLQKLYNAILAATVNLSTHKTAHLISTNHCCH